LKWAALVGTTAVLATAAQAQAATQIGETFPPTGPGGGCSGGFTRLQGVSPNNHYAAPFNGVITAWSYHAPSAPPQLRLKVARPAGGTVYTIVGQSALQTPLASQLNTYGGLRIPVQAGDLIGVYLAETGFCGAGDQAGYTEHIRSDDSQPGFMGSFDLDLPNSNKLDVSALLEPDCDGDGLGDETQDTDKSSCQADTNPPETTITKDAPKRSDTGKVKLRFKSDEAGSTFECKLKGKGLKPRIRQFNDCDSPRKYKNLDEGRYKFKVRAIDAASNVDLTPDKDRFRVVD
jgi:hypothetical protein